MHCAELRDAVLLTVCSRNRQLYRFIIRTPHLTRAGRRPLSTFCSQASRSVDVVISFKP